MTSIVNSYHRKVAGILLGLNYSIHHHALALDVIKFLMVGTIFNLTKANTVPSMCTATLSLRTANR